eukprot:m.178484 g.178484  ORF g.178484 m.178484 type:complete len:194 (+) comp31942_c0_seq1:1802-2383(+)
MSDSTVLTVKTEHALSVSSVLLAAGSSVAVCEATTGGLINASLQSCNRSSLFVAGAMVVYSAAVARDFLPRDLLIRLGSPSSNYANPIAYRKSKETFVIEMATHVRDRFGADYGIAESGATTVSGLPRRLRGGGAFTAVAVVGPDGFVVSSLFDSDTPEDRRRNMTLFAEAALKLLSQAIVTTPSNTLKRGKL